MKSCCSIFVVNTSIPNVTEIKENMTFGSTLVTNPKGGFLVRKKSDKCHKNGNGVIYVLNPVV
jgi:hypothetical protein